MNYLKRNGVLVYVVGLFIIMCIIFRNLSSGSISYTSRSQPPVPVMTMHTYSSLYRAFAHDLGVARGLAEAFCKNKTALLGTPHVSHCLTGILESELLYLRLRHLKPSVVLEVSSALGYSTLWILLALADNGHGHLHSFDVYPTPFPYVLDSKHASRWRFHRRDMKVTFPTALSSLSRIDYLHIDTCHDQSCIRWYLKNVVEACARKLEPADRIHVSAHDIYERYLDLQQHLMSPTPGTPTQEGVLFLEWLAYTGSAQHMHTVSNTTEDAAGPRKLPGFEFGNLHWWLEWLEAARFVGYNLFLDEKPIKLRRLHSNIIDPQL